MKSACGIDYYNVGISRLCGIYGIENNRRRICTLCVLDNIDARTVSPNLKLVNSRRSEGVSRTEQNLFALSLIHCGKLTDCSSLAHAVYTDYKDNGRLCYQTHILAAVKQFGNDIFHFRLDFVGGFKLLFSCVFLECFRNLNSRYHSDIRHNKNFFKLGIEVIGNLIDIVKKVVDCTRHFISGLCKTEVDFTENSHWFFLSALCQTEFFSHFGSL